LDGEYTILTVEETKGFNIGDFCRIDKQTEAEIGHDFYQISEIDEEKKTIKIEGNASHSIGKPLVSFGQEGDNIGICINGSTESSFGASQSISVFDFDPSRDTKIVPRIILGKLPIEEEIYGYAAGTYGLYAENVLLKGSLVTQSKTEDNDVMYSGISTVYTGYKTPKSTKLSSRITGHIPSEILLWAGSEDTT
jgi:hypothetical protein